MPTLTFTDTTDFGLLNYGSAISGSVLAGWSNFATDDTGTGSDDWTFDPGADGGAVALDTGVLDITSANTGDLFVSGSMANMANARYNAAANGNFEAIVKIAAHPETTNTSHGYASIVYRIDDSNFILCSTYSNSSRPGTVRIALYPTVGGTYQAASARTADPAQGVGDYLIKMNRTGNAFVASVSTDGGSTWNSTSSTTIAYATSGAVGISYDKAGTRDTASFDDFRFVTGFTGTAQALIGDQGTGTGRHIDAGVNQTLDLTSITVTLTNATVTYDIASNNTGTFSASAWDATGLSLAQLQAHSNGNYRYHQIRVNLTATGASPSFDDFSVDTQSTDITPPTDASATSSRIIGTGDATRVVVAWTNGTDAGSGVKGATVELEVSSVWYILKSDGSWAATASTASTLYEYIGSSGSKEGVLVDSEEGPSGFSGATRARITMYDNADNTNDLTVTVASDDFPAEGDVQQGVSYDNGNKTGTLALPVEADVQEAITYGADGVEFYGTFAAPAEGNVLNGVGYGAGGTEFTGTYSPPSPDYPDVGNVTTDDTVGGVPGTFAVPAVEDVEQGVQYGAGGTEFTGTLVPGGDAPTAPDITAVTAGDGQLTVSVAPGTETDEVYVLYAANASEATLSAPSDTFRRTGSGNVTLTGLTNGQVYLVTAISFAGGEYSEPAEIVFSAPSDGAGLSLSGPMTEPLQVLREMLSYSPTWQTLVNADAPTQPEALSSIYYESVPAAADGDDAETYTARRIAMRPLAVVWTGGEWTFNRDALSLYQGDGTIGLDIEVEVPAAYRGSDNDDDAMIWFQNQIGAIASELVAQANQAGTASRSFLRIQSVMLEEGPSRAHLDAVKTQGDWAGVTLMIAWGA